MKELKVTAIENGTVIDHIPRDMAFKVAEILGLQYVEKSVVLASNLDSGKLGKKGIVKVSGMYLDKRHVQKIALIAPKATVSRIKGYKVVDKMKLTRPKLITGIVKCFNPNCITNTECTETRFVLVREGPLVLRCRYCERTMRKEDMVLL